MLLCFIDSSLIPSVNIFLTTALVLVVSCYSLICSAEEPALELKIVTGGHHNCGYSINYNAIKCFGLNVFGQLGLGNKSGVGNLPDQMGDNLPFVNVTGTRNDLIIQNLSLGSFHSCVIFNNKGVKCWGFNKYGQLGYGDNNNRGDQPGEMGDDLPFIDFGKKKKVVQFLAGFVHNCVLLNDNTVVCFGANGSGELGRGNNESIGDEPNEMGDNLVPVDFGTKSKKVSKIYGSGTAAHTCATFGKSELKCWGYNDSGPLGLGDTNNRGDSPKEMGKRLPFIDLGKKAKIVDVAIGGFNTCVLLKSKATYCWGKGNLGQLGTGNSEDIGSKPNQMGEKLKPVEWGSNLYAIAVTRGDYFMCGWLSDGSIKCYGDNNLGQLGQGDNVNRGNSTSNIGDNLPRVDLGNGLTVKAITSGNNHVCVLFTNDKLKCYGQNLYGQIATGDYDNRGDDANEMGESLPFVNL